MKNKDIEYLLKFFFAPMVIDCIKYRYKEEEGIRKFYNERIKTKN